MNSDFEKLMVNEWPLIIHCALACEAKPIVDYYRLKKVVSRPFDVFAPPLQPQSYSQVSGETTLSSESPIVVVSGIGHLNACAACAWLGGYWATNTVRWLNLGIAGHPEFEIGSVVRVESIRGCGLQRLIRCSMNLQSKIPLCGLVSVEKASQEYESELLVDMEGSGFISSALKFSPAEYIHSLKIVSDNATTDFSQISPSNISELIDDQLESIVGFINRLNGIQRLDALPIDTSLFDHLRMTHSQRQQLNSKLTSLSVLGQLEQIMKSEAVSLSNVEGVLEFLETQLQSTPPRLSSNKDHG